MKFTIFFSALFLSCLLLSCKDDQLEVPDKGVTNLQAEAFLDFNPDSTIFFANQSLEKPFQKDYDFYSHFLIGYAYQQKNEFKNAASSYMRAFEIIPKENKYDKYRYMILYNLGWVTKTYGNYDLAIKYYEQALPYVPKSKKSRLLFNLGIALRRKQNINQSTKRFIESLDIAMEENDILKENKVYHQLGLLYSSVNDFDRANTEFDKVINSADLSNPANLKIVAQALHNKANTYQIQENYDTAIHFYKKALALKISKKDIFITLKDIGICFNEKGMYDSALVYLQYAENLYSNVPPVKENFEIYKSLNTAYYELGQYGMSQKAISTYFRWNDQFVNTKESLIEQYSAAEIASVLAAHQKNRETSQLIEQYLWYLAFAVSLSLISGAGFLLVRIAYQRSLKRERALKGVSREFSGFVDNLLKES